MAEEQTMGIWEHVAELRNRLFKAALSLVIAAGISFAIADRLIDILAIPIGGVKGLTSIEVTENFAIYLRVSLLSGFIFALPYILYQIIGFIMPGLLPHEKRWLMIALPLATFLFVGGVSFAFFVMMPAAIPILTNWGGIKTQVRPISYYDFITSLLFWIGVSFETPLVMYMLAKFRLVSARQLAQQWRISVVIIAIVAAVVTPTADLFNMTLLMLPLFALYLISIGLAWVARRDEEIAAIKEARAKKKAAKIAAKKAKKERLS